eukprot:SAG11_NODE_36538_length_261_cov_0.629630_1_plen_27_part_01
MLLEITITVGTIVYVSVRRVAGQREPH